MKVHYLEGAGSLYPKKPSTFEELVQLRARLTVCKYIDGWSVDATFGNRSYPSTGGRGESFQAALLDLQKNWCARLGRGGEWVGELPLGEFELVEP